MSSETFHEMYRRTTLGNTLQDSLDEMISHKLINNRNALKIMQKFDQCICTALSMRVKNRLNLHGRLNTYRNCDEVWTFVMNDVEIRDSAVLLTVDKMKIVACACKDAKGLKAAAVLKGNQTSLPDNNATCPIKISSLDEVVNAVVAEKADMDDDDEERGCTSDEDDL